MDLRQVDAGVDIVRLQLDDPLEHFLRFFKQAVFNENAAQHVVLLDRFRDLALLLEKLAQLGEGAQVFAVQLGHLAQGLNGLIDVALLHRRFSFDGLFDQALFFLGLRRQEGRVEGGYFFIDDGGLIGLASGGKVGGNLDVFFESFPGSSLFNVDIPQHVVGIDIFRVQDNQLPIFLDGLIPTAFLEINIGHFNDVFFVPAGRSAHKTSKVSNLNLICTIALAFWERNQSRPFYRCFSR